MTGLRVDGVSVELDATMIVDGVTIDITPGAFVGLLGPNGSGKTTLLRALHRALRPVSGAVLIGGDDVWSLSARHAAQRVAVVSQDTRIGFDYTVAEVAGMGRIPYQSGFTSESAADRRLIAEALDAVDLGELAFRPFASTSGGERQRTLIARALAQQAPVLLLDEPTNHLDIHYQLDVLHRVRSLGLTTLAALHDINLAAAWCDQVYVLRAGKVVAGGPPEEAMTAEMISDVFRVQATAFTHPVTGRHQLLFDRDTRPAP